MSGLHADTGAMNTNGKDTVTNSEYLGNERASLRNNMEGLMTLWRGLSANEFNKSYDAQDHNLEAFQQLINDLGVAISQSANILNETEEENANAGAHLF